MIRALLLTLLLAIGIGAMAADPWENYDEAAFMDMDLDENIENPVPDKAARHDIRQYVRNLAENMSRRGYIIELDRNDEVMVAVVPMERLFAPNDTLLVPRAPALMAPLLEPLTRPAMFKLIYVVHSDNTGSPQYNYDLSQRRVNTLYDWLLDNINEELIVIPFAMGDTDPIAPNTTRKGRAENRRVEFIYVPGPEMIEKALSKKLLQR